MKFGDIYIFFCYIIISYLSISLTCFSVNILNYCNSISQSLYKLYQLYELWGTYLIKKDIISESEIDDDRDESCLIEGKSYTIGFGRLQVPETLKWKSSGIQVDLDLEFNYF